MRRIALFALVMAFCSGQLLAGSITGTVKASGMRDSANAVVYIEKIEGRRFQAPEEPIMMDQRGKEFLPRVLPVLVGTTVNFLNSDPFSHNVFTPDKCAGKFNLGSWPTGETRTYTFTEPCEAVMLCNVHPEMVAFILVVETPFFAVTDAEGKYTISDVPDGTYSLSVWHEELDPETSEVTVSGNATIDFTLK